MAKYNATVFFAVTDIRSRNKRNRWSQLTHLAIVCDKNPSRPENNGRDPRDNGRKNEMMFAVLFTESCAWQKHGKLPCMWASSVTGKEKSWSLMNKVTVCIDQSFLR